MSVVSLILITVSIHLPFFVQTKIFLNHRDISYFTDFTLWPMVILSCCFSRYNFTLLSYLLVKIASHRHILEMILRIRWFSQHCHSTEKHPGQGDPIPPGSARRHWKTSRSRGSYPTRFSSSSSLFLARNSYLKVKQISYCGLNGWCDKPPPPPVRAGDRHTNRQTDRRTSTQHNMPTLWWELEKPKTILQVFLAKTILQVF